MSTVNGRISTYQELFNKVFTKRLKFVNNVLAILAVFTSVGLNLPYGKFWWCLLLSFIIRGPIIFVALFVIRFLRANTITVNYSHHKTLGSQIYYSVLSKQFLTTLVAYSGSAIVLGWVYLFQLPLLTNYYIISKDYLARPKINDEWVYFWCVTLFTAFVYSFQQIIFERNRLNFTYGVSKTDPKAALFDKVPRLFTNALVINTFIVLGFPVIYLIFRSTIYKFLIIPRIVLSLDSKVPRFGLTFKNFVNFGYYSFSVLFVWEAVNHIFNVYATIGCLDGKKPISTYSSDPINTLLSGLRYSDPSNELSRLTAFQELAYISSLNNPEGTKLRTAIFNAHSKSGFIWQAIIDECSLVIKQTTQRINYRSPSDASILQKNQIQIKEDIKDRSDIFGNSFIASPDKTMESVKSYDELVNKHKKPQPTKPSTSNQDKYIEQIETYVLKPLQKLIGSLITSNDTQSVFINKAKPFIKELSQFVDTYRNNFLSTWIGVFFRTNLKRDTESRVLNAVSYGNAVIALSNLLIHAIEEDRNFSITNHHISDTLNLLEKPIRACLKYTESLPPSVFLTLNQKQNEAIKSKHLINLLYELTLMNFKQLCIAYKFKLGDLFLSATCFRLAKRVIDEEIANRQQ